MSAVIPNAGAPGPAAISREASKPFFAVEECSVVFGGLTAVKAVTFSLDQGDLFGLIGPNGAGKTTLFNLVTGVYTPTTGRIYFEGRQIAGPASLQGKGPDIVSTNPAERVVSLGRRDIARGGICRTFQNIRLFSGLTVLENVMTASNFRIHESLIDTLLRTRRSYRAEQESRDHAMKLLEALKLEPYAEQMARSLPYGAQRRLEIARALATRPRLLLLDEPAAGMNPQESAELMEMIRWVRREYELTILLIEHDMKVVMGVCERIVVLDNGAVIANGPPGQIRSDPRVIAAYLGEPEIDGAAAEEASQPDSDPAGGKNADPSESSRGVGQEADPRAKSGEMLLELRDVSVHYGVIHAVEGLQIEVRQGEIVTLIGANGAGKSTTLRAISGLVRPSSGEIRFRGQDISAEPAHRIVRAGVGHAPEGRRIFPALSVLDNLALGAYTRRSKSEIAGDLDRVFTMFPRLQERRAQAAGTLSGGEQQMLAIGRALMSRPTLLLLDEPSLGLAPFLVQEIFRIIVEINRAGATVLLVEQNAHQALRVAHRGYVLETGRVILADTAERLLADEGVRKAYLGE